MKKTILIILIFSSACSPGPSLVGTWKAGGYSTWDKANAYLKGSILERSNKLFINSDSSWRIEGTCEVLAGSKWKVLEDSLLLFPDTSWGIHNPALNKSKSAFFGGHFSYKIKMHCLEKRAVAFYTVKDKHDSVKIHTISILEKLEPHQ